MRFHDYLWDLISASGVLWIVPTLLAAGWVVRKALERKSQPRWLDYSRVRWGWILLGIAVLVRVVLMLKMTPMSLEDFRDKYGGLNMFYFVQAMKDHLGAYLWNNTVKTPMLPFLNGILLQFVSIETAVYYNLFQIPIGVVGVIGTLCLYRAMHLIYGNRPLAFALALVFTLKQLQLEAMPIPIKLPDILTVGFVSVWTYGLALLIVRDDRKSRVVGALTSTLMVLSQIFHFAIVPITVMAIFVLKNFKAQPLRLWGKKAVSVLIAPVLVALLICAKNYAVSGFFAPSNLGGLSEGNILFAWIFNDHEPRIETYKKLVAQSEVPEWYRWCNDRIIDPKDENGQSKIWPGFAYPGGICAELTVDDPKAQCWPFDPRPLHQYLVAQGFHTQAKVVERDVQNCCDGRHLLAGAYPTLALGWFGYYGLTSSKMIRKLAVKRPYRTLRGMFHSHLAYSMEGPRFLKADTIPYSFPGVHQVYGAATWIFEKVLRLSYLLVWFVPVLFMIRRKRLRENGNVLLITVALSVFVHMAIVCYMTAWDLDRYFTHVTPLLVWIAPAWILRLWKLQK